MDSKIYMNTSENEGWQYLGSCSISWDITKERIVELIFNPPYTIINWSDGTKSISKANEEYDEFNPEYGFQCAIVNHFVEKGYFSKAQNEKRLKESWERYEKRMINLAEKNK